MPCAPINHANELISDAHLTSVSVARKPIPMSPEDLLEAGVLVYLDGFSSPAQT